MNYQRSQNKYHLVSQWIAALPFLTLCLFCLPASARVLDNFNDNVKTAWADTANGGTITESGARFNITTATANGSLSYSKKTSESFSIAVSHTLEFRVDSINSTPGNGDPNPVAILAWVPTGGAVLSDGYAFSAGANDIKIYKGSTAIYSTNFATAIQNTNTTLVLRLTETGGNVSINVRVYNKANGSGSLKFEHTVVDSTGPLLATSGNASLGVLNQAGAFGSTVVFDDLQVFDLNNTLADDFNTSDNLAGWSKFGSGGSSQSEATGQLELKTAAQAATLVSAIFSTPQTYKIVDGSRLEFSVTVVDNPNNQGAYAVMGYLPSTAGAAGLIAYFVSTLQGTGGNNIFLGKEFNRYFAAVDDDIVVVPNNVRYTQTYTGEGTSIRIDTRIENLAITDVNDPARLLFQNTFVDTAGNDGTAPSGDTRNVGTGAGGAYIGFDGFFIIEVFNAGTPLGADAFFDDARVSQTTPVNGAPLPGNFYPANGSNFVSLASSNTVQFHVADDVDTPVTNIALTLNGVRYTNGSPGVTITPSTAAASKDRTFTLTGALSPNVNYVGKIDAADNVGLAAPSTPLLFDTFLTSNLQVESEEYNFNSGVSIENPILVAEQSTDATFAYNSQVGVAEVDYHDNRGSTGPGYDVDHAFRTEDAVRTSRAGDPRRQKYVAAGPSGDLGYNEMMVQDIRENGAGGPDWLNYTHNYPAGTYNIYLRQAQYLMPQSLVTMERVTSGANTTTQTTSPLGSFLGFDTGFDVYRNVPLTDGSGAPVIVRFTGSADTLRLTGRNTGNADDQVGILFWNYFVLIPVPDPGPLRPFVSSVSPLPGSSIITVTPVITASIVNRDTTVGAVSLQVNGTTVGATVTPNATGADVSYTLPLPPVGSIITNTLIYTDSGSVTQSNTWTFTISYTLLRASNSLPVGSLTTRGFDYRMVQTDGATLGNSIQRAEAQLAIPSIYPIDRTWRTNIDVLNWSDGGAPWVPGLDDGPSGYPSGNYENISTEIYAYLELTAGPHRFRLSSDDRFQMVSGTNLTDRAGTVLFVSPGNTVGSATYDVVAEADGLYPTRTIWEENGGGARLQVWTVNLTTAADEDFLNGPSSSIKAWFPSAILLVSAATVNGPYVTDNTAVIDQNAKTVTVPKSGSAKFYKLLTVGTSNTTITSTKVSGANIVMTYQFVP